MMNTNQGHVNAFCDRARFRDLVETLLGSQYLPRAFYLSPHLTDIPWKSFPKEFVAKVTHGSGGLIGVWSGVSKKVSLPDSGDAAAWRRYWVNPDRFVESRAITILRASLESNYAERPGKLMERGYLDAKPQILVEELLLMPNLELATQTALYCFNGIPKFIRVSMRDKNQSRSFAWKSIDWTTLPFFQASRQKPFVNQDELEKPDLLKDMIDIASTLSSGLEFARVDVYNLVSRIVVGEVTLYPSGGNCLFVPLKYNRLISEFWQPNVR